MKGEDHIGQKVTVGTLKKLLHIKILREHESSKMSKGPAIWKKQTPRGGRIDRRIPERIGGKKKKNASAEELQDMGERNDPPKSKNIAGGNQKRYC